MTQPHSTSTSTNSPDTSDHDTKRSRFSAFLFSPLFSTFLAYVLDQPLFELYMNGPSLGGYGFHEGRERYTICSEMTGIPEHHWIATPEECDILIMRKFNAMVVTLHFFIYVVTIMGVLWSMCGCAMFWCCCRKKSRPMLCYRCAFRRSYGDLAKSAELTPSAKRYSSSSSSAPSSSSSSSES